MLFTRLKLKNWRNFREVDVLLNLRTYLMGANASGKSNLLDVFRFLRTIAQSEGGGLQKALKDREGLSKLRSLHARNDVEVRIEVELQEEIGDSIDTWRYILAFKGEGKGQQRVMITEESVYRNHVEILKRPRPEDLADRARLTQTHLEQINNNLEFRALADQFVSTTYLHLVPQLLKHDKEIGGRIIENDPFGQGLLQRIAKTPNKTRDARLRRIGKALHNAVPGLSELSFRQDEVTGLWHLEAKFEHWRPHGAWQREDQFSDGTLRLIGLLWALQEGEGLLLLEEPELSLNNAIVQHIPLLIERVLKDRKKALSSRQVLVSTHSETLLAQIEDPDAALLIEPGKNGSTVRGATGEEREQINHGLNMAEVILPKTRPAAVNQLGLFG